MIAEMTIDVKKVFPEFLFARGLSGKCIPFAASTSSAADL
jgi:hypothetical protein